MTGKPIYRVREASDGSFYFVLEAPNGQVLTTSETYVTLSSARRGMEAAERGESEPSGPVPPSAETRDTGTV